MSVIEAPTDDVRAILLTFAKAIGRTLPETIVWVRHAVKKDSGTVTRHCFNCKKIENHALDLKSIMMEQVIISKAGERVIYFVAQCSRCLRVHWGERGSS